MKCKLINEKLRFEEVEFDLNPTAMSFTRQAQNANRQGASQSAPLGASPSIFQKAPPKELSGSAYLVGDDVEDRADMLYSWMNPGGGLIGQLIGAAVSAVTGGRINLAAKPPVLNFVWGSQLLRCVLTYVKVDYERFSSSGEPNRAKVGFKLKEEPDFFGLLTTNPTSGGMPGRQRHIVNHSESLPTISTTAYGKPGLWRGVASANGIDDPFRVRPGDTIYLPNGNEIVGKR
jgi:nucleoid-associated protein YgaU